MDTTGLDKILDKLAAAASRKKTLKLAKANAEVEAIQREEVAYYDGAYDALKEVRALLAGEG